jgi:DNA-binding MarR family transcriptional regulator
MNDTTGEQTVSQGPEKEIPLPGLILRLSREQADLYERHFGMSQSRMSLLRELGWAGEISQIELAHRLGMEPTLVTRFVKQMEACNLVTRRTDPHDNRFTLVTLAPAGQQIAQRMKDFTHALEAQLIEGLSVEEIANIQQRLKQFSEKYEQIMKNMENEADL